MNFTIVSNGLDPNQDRHSVRPDLGPDCWQRSSEGVKSLLDANKIRKN